MSHPARHTLRAVAAVAAAVLALVLAGCDDEEAADRRSDADNGYRAVPDGWVDLGLPSGLLWAECNVGAATPAAYGDYIAWGETAPKDVYGWQSYRHATASADGNLDALTRYNTMPSFGPVDGLTALLPDDDAAALRLGSGARTPSSADWQELVDNSAALWTTLDGVGGCRFTGANGNSIFLPAAGGATETGMDSPGTGGFYWSSTLADDPDGAWCLAFTSQGGVLSYGIGGSDRYRGHPVRAVRPR